MEAIVIILIVIGVILLPVIGAIIMALWALLSVPSIIRKQNKDHFYLSDLKKNDPEAYEKEIVRRQKIESAKRANLIANSSGGMVCRFCGSSMGGGAFSSNNCKCRGYDAFHTINQAIPKKDYSANKYDSY